jgi:hypothetical protein
MGADPVILEDAAAAAVFDGRGLRSVARTVRVLFAELSRCFFDRAKPDPAAAADFLEQRLTRKGKPGQTPVWAVAAWDKDDDEMQLAVARRDALLILCGTDGPDDTAPGTRLDPRPRYLDPAELFRWANAHRNRLPPILVGPTHGDLHARNVLLRVSDGRRTPRWRSTTGR